MRIKQIYVIIKHDMASIDACGIPHNTMRVSVELVSWKTKMFTIIQIG